MITLEPVAELDVSAASGLVATGDALYVIADDETFLAVYDRAGRPRARVALLPDRLPRASRERKRQKPDFEALAALPDGRLLALGSGSTPARMRGALVEPGPSFRVRAIDLAPLYAALCARICELNIEGAAVLGSRLLLLQRGNGSACFNACIELGLHDVLASLDGTATLEPGALCAIERIELGALSGVPLSFTDATPFGATELLFTAAAEDTRDTYEDGACAGSIIGVLSGVVVRDTQVAHPACKLEGIAHSKGSDGRHELWLVADADDRNVRATLYRAELPVA